MFHQIFETRTKELWNLYQATGDLEHQGEKGLFREIFFRGILESILPHHFGVGSGVVVDKWNRQSPQVDLVIFDRRKIPPIFESQKHGIYPMDSVLRLIEVKSTLRKEGLVQFSKLINAVDPNNDLGLKTCTGTLENNCSYYPFASLFAYATDIENLSESIASVPGILGKTAPICVAQKGIFNISRTTTPESYREYDGMVVNLRHFLIIILDQLEATAASRKEYGLVEWLS